MKKVYFLSRKAQNLIEYAILISIVVAALGAMTQYVYRSIQAKLKQVQDEVADSTAPE